jgi:hypothetical protein
MPLQCLNSCLSAIKFRTSSRLWWPGQKITGRLGKGLKSKRNDWAVRVGDTCNKAWLFKCNLEMSRGYSGLKNALLGSRTLNPL